MKISALKAEGRSCDVRRNLIESKIENKTTVNKRNYFIFEDNIHKLKLSLQTSSLLCFLAADIFMNNLETIILNTPLTTNKKTHFTLDYIYIYICWWRWWHISEFLRQLDLILKFLNNYHKNIIFTKEEENENKEIKILELYIKHGIFMIEYV